MREMYKRDDFVLDIDYTNLKLICAYTGLKKYNTWNSFVGNSLNVPSHSFMWCTTAHFKGSGTP